MFVSVGKQALGGGDDQKYFLGAQLGEMILEGVKGQMLLSVASPLGLGVKKRAYGFVSGRINKTVLESETRIDVMRRIGHGAHQI